MSEPAETIPPGLLLCDDLIFASRIIGTARTLGREVRQVRAPEQLPELAGRLQARCVIVDLAFPGLDLAELMRRLGESGTAPRVVAYGSHVDAESLRAARAAGCQPVLPRSKFVKDLPHELGGWLVGVPPEPFSRDPKGSAESERGSANRG